VKSDLHLVERAQPIVLTLFRVVVGLLFACHGVAKLTGALGGAAGRGGSVPVGSWPLWWAGLIELVGGSLVVIGLATRLAALISSGEMAFAYFTVHQPRALFPIQNKGDLAALFCWSFLMLAVFGPGRWALDRTLAPMLRRRTPVKAK
jgi:putative oxidoreductase